MRDSEKVYLAFGYGEEIPMGLQAHAEGAQVMIRNSIRYLVATEIQEHLAVVHDCRAGCYSGAAIDAVMEEMPESQVRFIAVELVHLLARAFLRDNPDALAGLLFGGDDGPE